MITSHYFFLHLLFYLFIFGCGGVVVVDVKNEVLGQDDEQYAHYV